LRVVLRILLIEFSVAWLLVLAGMVQAGLQALPFFAHNVASVGRRIGWRRFLAFFVGGPIVVGWPLMFVLIETERGYHLWMRGIAIPWWIVVGCGSLMLLAAKAQSTADRAAEHT
jgi:hypothetical protein